MTKLLQLSENSRAGPELVGNYKRRKVLLTEKKRFLEDKQSAGNVGEKRQSGYTVIYRFNKKLV